MKDSVTSSCCIPNCIMFYVMFPVLVCVTFTLSLWMAWVKVLFYLRTGLIYFLVS
jgi:hypothetical protein